MCVLWGESGGGGGGRGNVGINGGGFGLLPPPPPPPFFFFSGKDTDVTLLYQLGQQLPLVPVGTRYIRGKGEREGQTEREGGVCRKGAESVCVCVCV